MQYLFQKSDARERGEFLDFVMDKQAFVFRLIRLVFCCCCGGRIIYHLSSESLTYSARLNVSI